MRHSSKIILFGGLSLIVVFMGITYLLSNWFSVLNFLDTPSGSFNVLFSSIVAIATGVYAALTYRLVSETEKLRTAQTEPDVSVIIKPQYPGKNSSKFK